MTDSLPPTGQRAAAARDVSDEHSPMCALDEFLIHTTAMPIRVVSTTDVRAYERHWFTCQDRTGDLLIDTGVAVYPNLNTAEAFTMVNLRGRLINLHAHRRLGDNRMNMRVGPLDFDLVEAFKHWRLTLGENRFGIAYELHWYDTKRAVFHSGGLRKPHGTMSPIPVDTMSGYETFGKVEGWVTVEGERFTLDTGSYCGVRDHHWGVREGVGGKAHMRSQDGELSRLPWCGTYVEFKDWSILAGHLFYNVGDPRPGSGSFVAEKRTLKLKFDPESHLFSEGLVTDWLETGEKKEMHLRRLGNQIAYMRCGMYGEPSGGTPDGDIWHGMYVGDDVVGGGVYDTNDPAVRIRLAGLDQHHCAVSCGTETAIGIVEITDPIVYARCLRGKGRYSLWED